MGDEIEKVDLSNQLDKKPKIEDVKVMKMEDFFLSQSTPTPPKVQVGQENEDSSQTEKVKPIEGSDNIIIDERFTPIQEDINASDPFLQDPLNLEDTGKYENLFFKASNLSAIIAAMHNSFLPGLFIKGYEQIFFNGQPHIDKCKLAYDSLQKAIQSGEEIKQTEEQRADYLLYQKYVDFKINKAPLTDSQIDMLQKAWEWQLNKWGIDDRDINVHPMLQAYGGITVEKAAPVIMEQIKPQ